MIKINDNDLYIAGQTNPGAIFGEFILEDPLYYDVGYAVKIKDTIQTVLWTEVDSIFFGAKDSLSMTLDIITDTDWALQIGENWLTAENINGKGTQSIELKAAINQIVESRFCTIIITTESGLLKEIIISQSKAIITGIINFKSNEIVIAPNPTTKYITIQSPKVLKRILIFDMTGNLLKQEKLSPSILDVQFLDAGIYNILLISEDELIWKKFIKL